MIELDALYFAHLRIHLFRGRIQQSQVDGMQAIANAWNELYDEVIDQRQLAYCLATAYHETAQTMQPVREVGRGHGRPYGVPDPITKQVYYGRGYVQLTWKRNYQAMGTRLNLPLVSDPDKALEPAVAAKILIVGMMEGIFTGARLQSFFNLHIEDPVNARRTVNGLDRAENIADYYNVFADALGLGL